MRRLNAFLIAAAAIGLPAPTMAAAPCTPFTTFPLVLNFGTGANTGTGEDLNCAMRKVQSAINAFNQSPVNIDNKADKTQLGSGIGISWQPFQTRLLITKDQQPGEHQPALDIQVNTRAGTIDGGSGVGSGLSITSRAFAETKYGQFNLVALTENYSQLNQGDPFFGNTGSSLYIRQNDVKNAPGWGYAAEAKETHGLPDPLYGTLAGENAIVATGTDSNHKRGALFLPLNILPGKEATFTEAYHGTYTKTAPNSRYFHGSLFEGDYINVITASGVNARSFLVGTGNYSAPIIDLHAVQSAGNGAAIAMNATHSIQWQDAGAQTLGGIGYDTSVSGQPTMVLSGVRTQNAPGGGLEAVLSINGVRYGIALRASP